MTSTQPPELSSTGPDSTTSACRASSTHSKPCTLCTTPRDVLVRCQIDDSGKWHFVCPGKCWRVVSGGKVDGDGANKFYRYGGMWKNKHDAVSAKMKKSAKKRGANKKVERAQQALTSNEDEEQEEGEDGADNVERNHAD